MPDFEYVPASQHFTFAAGINVLETSEDAQHFTLTNDVVTLDAVTTDEALHFVTLPVGPRGRDGASTGLIYANGASTPPVTHTLSGDRVVRSYGSSLDYAQPTDPAGTALFFTNRAIEPGVIGTDDVVMFGSVYVPGANFTANTPLFLAVDGHLTTTAPSGPGVIVRLVGWTTGSETFLFNPSPGIRIS